MKTLRKLLLLTIIVVMITTLVACKDSKKVSNVISDEAFSVRIVGTTSGFADGLINEFHKYYPNATLEYVYNPPTTNTNFVKSEFENGNGPEISIVTDYNYFVENEYFYNIISENVLNHYNASAKAALIRNTNQIYAVPVGNGRLYGLVYNKTMFDNFNLEYPSGNESLIDLVKRVDNKIQEEKLADTRPIALSLIYPDLASSTLFYALSEYTQSIEYLSFISDLEMGKKDFTSSEFQSFLSMIQEVMDGNFFDVKTDLTATEKQELVKVVSLTSDGGGAFLSIGDVTIVPSYMQTASGSSKNSEIIATGIPTGQGGSYVFFSEDTYLGINSEFESYSEAKQSAIRFLLNALCGGEYSTIVSQTNFYNSNYLNNSKINTITDTNNRFYNYYKDINKMLENNMVADDVSAVDFCTILGNIIIAWADGTLRSASETSITDIEKATSILENYRLTGQSPFTYSSEVLVNVKEPLVFNNDLVRTQETRSCDFFADSVREYMGSDIAVLNSGSFRTTIPEDISGKAVQANFKYKNYLVNVKMSGKTLKAFLQQSLFTTTTFHNGKFPGGVSGLKITYGTSDTSYADFSQKLQTYLDNNPDKTENEGIKYICNQEGGTLNTWISGYTASFNTWLENNPNATLEACNDKIRELAGIDTIHIMEVGKEKKIVLDSCESFYWVKLLDVTMSDGTPIDDNKIYTVTMTDYMLKGGDGYTTIQVLNPVSDTDMSITICDRNGNQITGSTIEELSKNITDSTKIMADGFIEYFKELKLKSDGIPVIEVELDGRLNWVNKIYYTN